MNAKRFLKRLACLALGAVLVLGCLTACGGGGDGGKKTLKVFLYMNDHEQEVYTAMIEQFKKDHADEIDDIDFQITTQDQYNTTLTGMMTANQLPDVFYVGPAAVKSYVDNGYVANLTPLLEAAKISTDDLPQNTLDFYRYDGNSIGAGDLYALPKDASTFAYAYNKDVFDKAGVPYPDPNKPYTYDEFVEVLQKLTMDTNGDGEIDQWGASFADLYMFQQYVYSNGATFLDETNRVVTIDTPEFKEALQKYFDLTFKYGVTPTYEQDVALGPYQRWIAGQTGFYAAGTWDVASFMDPNTFPYNWDLCYYPTLSTGISYTWNGTVGFCISAKSEKKDIALKLINYLSTDADGQRKLSGMDGSSSVQVPNLQSLQDEFKAGVANGTITYPANVDVIFNYINGSDIAIGRMQEADYTPNNEWITLFWEAMTNYRAGNYSSVDELVSDMKPKMQASLDKAWATADAK